MADTTYVFDADGLILGRLASKVADLLLKSARAGNEDKVVIINAEKAVVSGHPDSVVGEYQKKYEVTYERHISELGKIREAALKKGAFSAANNAEVARGKAAGLYVEQKIIRTGKLDDMTKEEMETELKNILDELGNLKNF